MDPVKVIFVQCGFLLLCATFSDAVMCYKCDHVAHPRDCDRIVACNDGEVCHVISYAQPDGHFYYNTGCLAKNSCPSNPGGSIGRRDIAFCNRCCNGHYCNKELCDGPPPAPHGPRCLQCQTVENAADCGAVTECSQGQVCFTKEKYVFGERRYQLGCADAGCTPLSRYRSLGSKRSGECLQCCTGENCNRDLCKNTGLPLTSAPATVGHHVPPTAHVVPPQQTTMKPVQHQTTHVYNVHGCHFRGSTYKTNETWDDGCDFRCTCIDGHAGRYSCQDICPTWVNVPDVCTLVKPDGECCSKPVCHGHNVTTTNVTSTSSINECYFKGQKYKQDATWRDGCDFDCQCTDASRGYYRCKSLCYTWNLPPKCHLNPPAPGKCCQTPSCPAGYKINYPPNYVEN